MKITNGKDFWAGLMFVAFGVAFMLVSRNYAMGTSVRMGPAYFPTMLGGLLAVLGGVVLFRAFVTRTQNPLRVFPFVLWRVIAGLALGVFAYYTQPSHDANIVWEIGHALVAGLSVGLIFAAFGERSLWVILFSVVIFGYVLKPLGLVAAVVLLVVISAWGGHEFKWKEVTILSVSLAIFAVLAFVKGLGLPMNVWPSLWE
ncbi:MAG TPA: tripartite tricarboxylate transporter TctB family protein [Burkholderiales bacterium]|nr:tripartite tricarboxylate transporter TctB family protein [Burkholderiales bacterium]